MACLPRRDLAAEVAKHFRGTAEERVLLALDLGQQALDVFLAALPPGSTRLQAAAIARRNKRRGRRPSEVMETGHA
jgi:hypothetical protein